MKASNGLFQSSGYLCLSLFFSLTLASCSPQQVNLRQRPSHKIYTKKAETKRVGEAHTTYLVLDHKNDLAAVQDGDGSVSAPSSFLIGFPISSLNQAHVFGGVITTVSNRTNPDFGRLKLADLPPLHVTPVVAGNETDGFQLVLAGCVRDCTESSEPEGLIGIPIMGLDETEQYLILNTDALGKDLNLVSLLGGDEALGLREKTSATTFVDFSKDTLVFDVQSVMVPTNPESSEETVFTARWYLKQSKLISHPDFAVRAPTAAVGFFETDRAATTKIMRWALQREGAPGVEKYYIKNVPDEFKADFVSAFASWNKNFTDTIGQNIFEYEFIDQDDPRSVEIVTGDIRYNVLEWDLVNQAPYGGLGPSIGNQLTGELFSANVLVQGPRIVELYSNWFAMSQRARSLRAKGRMVAADKVEADFRQSFSDRGTLSKNRFKLSLNENLEFRIPAQMPEFMDLDRFDFDPTPAGYTFKQYMTGYWYDIVAHELGHNLGLRHNFRGNLLANDHDGVTKVSNSIMEYLGRTARYLSSINDYDRMAIAYGYTGEAPAHSDWYCTDENAAAADKPGNSPECSSADQTADPFGFFKSNLKHAADLLVGRGSDESPNWTPAEIDADLNKAVTGVSAYYGAAETAASWTNWLIGEARPTDHDEIKNYVVSAIKGIVCDPSIGSEIERKSGASRDQAKANYEGLLLKVKEVTSSFHLPDDVAICF